jgi:ankyrin repeat protein
MTLAVRFVEEDPGRQSISGSFNPIDEGEWSESAYIQPMAKFFGAISKNDTVITTQMTEDGVDVNCRDHVGRTPLHVAILSNSVECANTLIDAGARMTARLVGGRTSLHLASQMGHASVVKKMLARSAYNVEKAAEEKTKAEAAMAEDAEDTERVRMSSEDDWSSEESIDVKAHKVPPTKNDAEKDADPLEEDKDEPDILDVSISDWDFGLTALGYAIVFGSVEVADVLLVAGADPNFATRVKGTNPLHPLALTQYTQSDERAAKIAERLVAAQAISSTADEKRLTIFHRLVLAKKTRIVASLLRCDQNAKKVLDIPARSGSGLVFPVISSIFSGDYATMSVLLAHGAKLAFSSEDTSRAKEAVSYVQPSL